ncbi:MAG TPA: regulatory protein RecX [Ideonella sp.]|uniref:regulatory protein RecX n=1 Tax=Ideonella sp. TaxID=1929293 RepID=UPI002E2F1167|nr:regulatory protein RecX [Ideonella sp.]HEX5687664.1 regulatory protein RecX [Ideonella sp.]
MKRPLLSLKAQAYALLARREHSRAELRNKLLAHARKRAQVEAAAAAREAAQGPRDPWDPADDVAPAAEPCDAEAAAGEVDALLDELEAARRLSDARFAESRVHARAKRQGTARIKQELARHGVQMDPDTARQLRETELERAREVWRRKYGGEPATEPAERARQMRFLGGRGFAGDVVRRVVGGREDE